MKPDIQQSREPLQVTPDACQDGDSQVWEMQNYCPRGLCIYFPVSSLDLSSAARSSSNREDANS